jgi:hypothetical protein
MAVNFPDAVIEKYGDLTADRPTYLYFEYIPVKNPDGTALSLPIVAFYKDHTSSSITFSKIMTEVHSFSFTCYDTTYEGSRSIANAILYNNESPDNLNGFAYCLTFPVPTGYTFEQCTINGPVNTSRVVDKRTEEALNCYLTTFSIGIQVQRNT